MSAEKKYRWKVWRTQGQRQLLRFKKSGKLYSEFLKKKNSPTATNSNWPLKRPTHGFSFWLNSMLGFYLHLMMWSSLSTGWIGSPRHWEGPLYCPLPLSWDIKIPLTGVTSCCWVTNHPKTQVPYQKCNHFLLLRRLPRDSLHVSVVSHRSARKLCESPGPWQAPLFSSKHYPPESSPVIFSR